MVHTSPFPSCPSTHIGFIGLDVFAGLPTDAVLIRADHADTQLVENLKGCLVAQQPELTLELNGRDARRLAGDQIGRPEPDRERRVRTLHDGAGGEIAIDLTVATPKNGRTVGEPIRLVGHLAARTNEPVAPACTLKIGRARHLVREQSLKFWKRARKRQIAPLKHIDSHRRHMLTRMADILPIVSLGVNRISTVYSMTPK